MNGKGLPDKAFSRFVEENVEKCGQVLESVGEIKIKANQVIGEWYNGLAKTITEKDLLVKKKKRIRRTRDADTNHSRGTEHCVERSESNARGGSGAALRLFVLFQ